MRDLRLIERPHVHVAFGGPCCAGDVAQSCCSQVETGLAIRECTDNAGPPTDLFHDPLEWVVGADLLPVDVRKSVVGQRLGHAALDQIGRRVHLAGSQIFDDRSRFAVGRVAALLGMDGFEHVAHLADPGCRHMAEDVPIKMNHAALPPSVGQIFRGALHQTSAGIGDDELHAVEAAIDQVAQER